MNYPCWLSNKDQHIAQSLEKTGFIYCGREEDHVPYDKEFGSGYKLAKVCGWQLASAYGEVAIEARRDGAIFGKCLEVLPNIDFEEEVKQAKRAIKQAAEDWQKAQSAAFEQLSFL